MARITEKQSLVLERDEALKYIKNLRGKVRYQVFVSCFLPTEGNKGFEGSTCISVSRKDMIKIIGKACSETLSKRGAKVKLKARPSEYSDGLSFVTLY